MAKIDGLRDIHGRFMQARELYARLQDNGFMSAKSRLRDEGGRCGINGVLVTLLSKGDAEFVAQERRKQFVHRVLAECDCGRNVPFGKLGQHRKSCHANVWED